MNFSSNARYNAFSTPENHPNTFNLDFGRLYLLQTNAVLGCVNGYMDETHLKYFYYSDASHETLIIDIRAS